ncbi:hypothetical protein BVC93_03795 [Mycobacterium sp. MS1601]|uniref:hypothetical protein n=1 Tax=Mycobacterium sp. MS1601 TaxID=1936029 RepID=UPI0009790AD9|nr:hypothetical protein [Mycobacterium sp. MS1601]AQA01697.1 hypothetical protein BVC93_03795 [Mycobacterium sp. MS1601]
MSDQCDVDELHALFVVEGLTDRQLHRLCADAEVVTLPPGVLCGEGDPATVFYVLPDGKTALSGECTGRGLDTVTRIVNRHRGNLWVESKPGDTCFTVLLPLTIAPDAALPDFAPRPIPALNTAVPDTDAT